VSGDGVVIAPGAPASPCHRPGGAPGAITVGLGARRRDGPPRHPEDAFPTDRVYGPTAGPELRLNPGGGSFDSGAGSYRDDTVVFAREVT
jgi:hypothetical protein